MKRKILVFGIILCMLIGLAVVPVLATVVDSGTCGDNLTWTLDDAGTLTISGTGDMKYYDAYHNWRSPWYSLRLSIKAVVIGSGVTSIEHDAFYECNNLTSITIPDSVTSIGGFAFTATAWYDNQPDGLVYAGKVAYRYKGTMPQNTNIVLKDDTKGIAAAAFYECDNLKSITVPYDVTSIGYDAFYCCKSLTSIIIPDSVTSIGAGAFSHCSNLTSITIPYGVTSIGYYAFDFCESLTSITIPDSVTSIGYGAFEVCTKLNSVKIGSGITRIEHDMFSGCSSLTSITIPDSVTSIGNYAFDSCRNLTSITIPDSVTSIGDRAFSNCSSLTSITIPDNVTSIGNYVFNFCEGLTSITIPDSVISIGAGAFTDCYNITDVYYGGSEEDWSAISISSGNTALQNATIHYNHISSKNLNNVQDYEGNKLTILENGVLDIGEELYFRNGYVDASKGYIKTGDRKITGSNIYFTSEGKIRLDDGENAKIERDNGDGTTNQGFIFGKINPSGIIKVILDVTGEAGGIDYTGKTVEKEFDFTGSEIYGLANFGFEIASIPKPVEFYVHED